MFRFTMVLSVLLFAIPLHNTHAEKHYQLGTNEGFVNNSGVNIWYKIEGPKHSKSLPLLLIHGGPGATARPFEKTLGPLLATNRKVIYMDYRGTGRSGRPKEKSDYSFDILAKDIEALRKHLNIQKLVVFGHSNGAVTSISYALKHPKVVAGLVLCAPLINHTDLEMNLVHKVALAPPKQFKDARAIYQSEAGLEERFFKLLSLIHGQERHNFQFYNHNRAELLTTIQSELKEELGKALMEQSLVNGLVADGLFEFNAYNFANKLMMPTLVILGRFDSEISVDNGMKFALTVPNGQIALLSKSGHHPYLEQPELTSEKIATFIDSIEADQ